MSKQLNIDIIVNKIENYDAFSVACISSDSMNAQPEAVLPTEEEEKHVTFAFLLLIFNNTLLSNLVFFALFPKQFQ